MLPKSPNYISILFVNDSQYDAARKAGVIAEFLLNPTHSQSSTTTDAATASSKESNRLSTCSQGTPAVKELFNESSRLVDQVLYGKPFERFLDDSNHFKRFLQIKHLEKMPINKNTFRMYRGTEILFFFIYFIHSFKRLLLLLLLYRSISFSFFSTLIIIFLW